MTSQPAPERTGLRVTLALLCASAGALTGACTGGIDETRAGGSGDPSSSSGGPGGRATACAPLPIMVHRLSNNEYANTVADIFGAPASVAAGLPPDSHVDSFDNNVSGLTLSTTHLQRYMEAAWMIASDVFGTPAKQSKVVGCAPGGTCLETFIDRIGRWLYRRPLLDDERRDLKALAAMTAGETDPYAPFKVTLQTLLQSPSFLLRGEVGVPDPSRPGWRRLTGYEMATRLSYLFWVSTPDERLLDAAGKGQLDTAEGVEAVARALLAEPRAAATIRHFSGQWMHLYQLDAVVRDPMRYPYFGPARRQATLDALKEEALRLGDDFLWKDGSRVVDLLTAPYTYLHAATAWIYGLPAPRSPWERTMLALQPRSGLLTLPGFLTITSETERVAPIRRGKFVREALLCETLQKPAGVPQLPEMSTGRTVREVLQQHRKDPACGGCHQLIDPVGFGLENYDIVGRYSPTDDAGNVLTGQGFLAGFDNPDFTGARQLGERLRDAPEASACFIRQLFRYAYGRTEEASDACALDTLAQLFRSANYNFKEALVALARTDSFRHIGGVP